MQDHECHAHNLNQVFCGPRGCEIARNNISRACNSSDMNATFAFPCWEGSSTSACRTVKHWAGLAFESLPKALALRLHCFACMQVCKTCRVLPSGSERSQRWLLVPVGASKQCCRVVAPCLQTTKGCFCAQTSSPIYCHHKLRQTIQIRAAAAVSSTS